MHNLAQKHFAIMVYKFPCVSKIVPYSHLELVSFL